MLVADDSRVIRQAIRKILDTDFEVVLAESGDAAWGFLARDQNFQMLVTDIEMPGMDGYELICRIRGSEGAQYKNLPVLTITGAEDEQTKERAFACGATDFITKPIDAMQLKARVHSYVRLEQSARDMAEKAAQLEDQAIIDPLTGLRSRRYFLQRGEQDLAYCVRNEKDITVIRFDIDRYKDIYRKYGDDVGDRILIWLAGVISANARVEDTVARVAGSKFAILATATDLAAAKTLCQRVRDAIRDKPFMLEGMVIDITLSFGLASLMQDRTKHIDELMKCSEERVSRAMSDGGDRVCVSVLGDTAPQIEEVVIDVPVVEEPLPEVVVPPATLAELPDELEIPGATESVAPATPEFELGLESRAEPESPPQAPVLPQGTDDAVAQLLSIDKALQLIASGHAKLLEPYLYVLKQQLQPLLDLIARDKDVKR